MMRRLAGLLFLWAVLAVALLAQLHTGTGSLPVPAISGITASGFTVTWTTSSNLNTQVWYSRHASPPTLGTQLANWKLVTAHTATIAGLAAGVTYDVQVESSYYSNPDLVSPVFTITTASASPTLSLRPGSATLQVGQTQAFTAAYSDGSPVGSLTWSASNNGQISANGVFTATATGNFTITATDGVGRSAHALVSVQTPSATGLPTPIISNVTTTSFTLTWQTSSALNTQVHYSLSGSPQISSYANWKLTTAHTAVIAGLQAGATYAVVAESSYYSNPDLLSPSFTVTLASPPPTRTLSLNPSTAALQVGQTQAFTPSYSDGSPVGTLTWSVNNGGSISTSGLFTATTAGTFTVTTIDANNLSASATVTVQNPPPSRLLQLSPATAALQVGQTQAFTASYSDGSPVGTLTWSVNNGGSISTSGLFSATAAGTFTVTAIDANGLSASATVAVENTPLTLTIRPTDVVLIASGSQHFSAAYSDGSAASVTWTATNGGTITADGSFDGSSAGTYVVTATDANGMSAMTNIQVEAPSAPPPAAACPGCFFTSPQAAWLYVGSTPAWGRGRDISALSAQWIAPGVTTNQSGFGMPVQHTQEADGFTSINDFNYGPGWRHDSANVPNPPSNQWTPSCGWLPPSQFGQTSCYGAYDGKDFIIDDTNGNFYEIDQLYVDSSGHPINFGVNGYGTGVCGGAGQTVCGIRGIFSGNLATSAPNLGGSTAAGIVSGAGVIVPGELECPTCLNHMIQVLGTSQLVNATTCNAFPVGKNGDGGGTLPHAVLCEGGILQYTGDWTQLDPATHSTAVIALARALQLYGGMMTDQVGTSSSPDHVTFYADYDTAPNTTGIGDLMLHLAVFYGTTTLTGEIAP